MDIIESLKVSELTKQNYKYKYNKVNEYGIHYYDYEDAILNRLKNINDKYNNISEYINVIIVLRKATGLPINKIIEYRDDRRIFNEDRETDTNKKNKKVGLPSLSTLQAYTNELYEKGEYKKYIINFLILYTNCRNKDLDLIITDKPVEGNYILLEEEKAIYVRNNYKTVDTYGPKKFIIEEPAFIYACNQLGHGPLLENVNKNEEIIKSTYQHLGQSRYFKIITSEASINQLKQLSSNRGTAPNTIINFYT